MEVGFRAPTAKVASLRMRCLLQTQFWPREHSKRLSFLAFPGSRERNLEPANEVRIK